MNHLWILALQLSFFGLAPSAFSQALEETSSLLNNSGAREKAAVGNPAAEQALQQVKDLGLSTDAQAKLFELTGKIFEKMSVDSDGDTQKMDERVRTLMRNPASLESIISADQKQQIRDLAGVPECAALPKK